MNIELPLDGNQRDVVRPVSKALFKSEYALEAFMLIFHSPRFYKSQLAELTGCQPSFASAFVRRLHDAKLVEPVPTEEGQQRQYMRKSPSPIWPLLAQVGEMTLRDEGHGGAEVTRLPQRP